MSHMSTRARLKSGAARGLLSVRADAGAPSGAEIKALIDGVNRAFEEFKASHQQQLAELKKGLADAVTAEKVEKINAAITEQKRDLDEAVRRMAALNLGGGAGGEQLSAEMRQHKEQFGAYARRGVQAAVTTYNDPDGGFLAPPTLDLAVTRIVSQTVAMRRLAQVMPITASSYVKFKSLGGATSGWVGENETGTSRPETNTPRLSRMEFTPEEIYAEPYATQVALDDMAVDVEAWLASEVAIEFAEEEGDAFIDGNGVKKPRGILSYSNVANSSYAWGSIGYIASGNASAFIASSTSAGPGDCFLDTVYALKPAYRANASWLVNDLTAARMRKFRDGDGNYLWQPVTVAGQPSLFMGYPVETDDNMPDVGADAFPIAFADFRQAYLVVDRVGVRVLRNPYKSNGLVAFYTTKRVGGGVQNFEAIKLIKIATS